MDFKESQVCPRVASLTFQADHKPENQPLSRNLKAISTQTTVYKTEAQTHLVSL
jgi:hypothetical protein